MSVRLIAGDCRAVLAGLQENSVQMVCTSPPYFNLRAYLPNGHESKQQEIGTESSVTEYVANIVAVFREVRRVLRPDGVLFLVIGDSYASGASGFRPGSGRADGVVDERNIRNRNGTPTPDGLKPKDLIGIPWEVAFALRRDGWWLRSEITWAKKAPMPESVTDRPTSATEKIFLLTKSARYFYDAEAVKEASVSDHPSGNGYARPEQISRGSRGQDEPWQVQPTRNMRNWWPLGPEPFAEAHFATFPSEIPRRAILAGSSEKGACPACGSPYMRVVEREKHPSRDVEAQRAVAAARTGRSDGHVPGPEGMVDTTRTVGWQPGCRCENAGDPIPCVILDPFSGSGTSGVVACRLGRDYIGIDLNPEYIEMSRRRIVGDAPMFNTVDVVQFSCDKTDRDPGDSMAHSPLSQLETLEMAGCDEQEG